MRKQIILIFLFSCACLISQAQENIIVTIAGIDTPGFRGDGGPATNAMFDHADMLWLDNFGNLYISDAFNDRIRKIDIATNIITTVAGNGTGGYNGDGIQATDAELWIPQGVCTDTLGNIYIADPGNSRVRKIDISTGIITTVVGIGGAGNAGDGGPATNALINAPLGLTIDKHGNLYITDINNYNVRKVDNHGIITTIAGTGGMGYSGDGGSATAAELNEPGKAFADSFGNIIITDPNNNAIRKVFLETGTIETIAGNGTAGYSGDGGPASNAILFFPFGLFIDKQNNIFFVEGGNGVVRKIDGATGLISTVVGCGVQGFSGDGGPATLAELRPDDVVIDKYGTMYITDYRNNRIRKVYNPALGITNIQSENKIIIYPNPTKDELTIEHAADCEMKIINLLGQEMLKSKINSNKETVNTEPLTPGMYLVLITALDGTQQNLKFVKE